MLTRIGLALLAAVATYLACIFLGGLIALINVPVAEFIGHFIVTFAVALSVLAALAAFFGALRFP